MANVTPESFLRFTDEPVPAGFKTRRVRVWSARHGDALGGISWYGPWRQYIFEAGEGTVWSKGCLAEVEAKIGELMAERRKT